MKTPCTHAGELGGTRGGKGVVQSLRNGRIENLGHFPSHLFPSLATWPRFRLLRHSWGVEEVEEATAVGAAVVVAAAGEEEEEEEGGAEGGEEEVADMVADLLPVSLPLPLLLRAPLLPSPWDRGRNIGENERERESARAKRGGEGEKESNLFHVHLSCRQP